MVIQGSDKSVTIATKSHHILATVLGAADDATAAWAAHPSHFICVTSEKLEMCRNPIKYRRGRSGRDAWLSLAVQQSWSSVASRSKAHRSVLMHEA
jgi:hypothetical protein